MKRASFILVTLSVAGRVVAADPVEQAEAARIDMIARVSPSVVCVFDEHQLGGGSGVILDAEGYGLTNQHVVAGMLDTRRGWGGLDDGKLYELEVLGIDPTGDVAMFRMLGDRSFPWSRLGDSDALRVGEAVVAMGNPFSVSEDYTPSVSLGVVSGVHRYQAGKGKNLVYSDCLQVDAAINPGNSGGPLFNLAGEVVGINGRISVKGSRGKLNVGFGYAITSDQIRRFIPALRAGLLAKHGTLSATIDPDGNGGLSFGRIDEQSNAFRAGLRRGDRLLRLGGVSILSGNQYLGQLGAYPADWPVPIEIERGGERREIVVRLDPVNATASQRFLPDREINVREIDRVLRKFQKATFAGRLDRRPTSWRWTARREYTAGGAEGEARVEQYEVSQVGDGPARWRRRYDDGAFGPTFEATDRRVIQTLPGDDTLLEPPLETQLTLSAQYIMQRWLLVALETLDLSGVQHVGGDRSLSSPPDSRTPECILEVLDWPVGDHARCRFAFDQESGRLMQARVGEVSGGTDVNIQLLEHRDVGGLVWPVRTEVTSGGRRYTESVSEWELNP